MYFLHHYKSWFIGNEPELGDFRGCFFINTSAEFSDPKSEISCYCRYHKDQVRQLIKSKLTNNSERSFKYYLFTKRRRDCNRIYDRKKC